ncbi:mannose-6-phosphate isomerase [Polaribacter vadi]|jgi:mannose-6-phosphate isomerase-like protein (cupin superfamily)|uniref:Mannose-6-phosphate isomerase n=1 Tax=Polaribacter vadi TaxID=1774273 RepID=A0A1B8TTH3_9FLAO|nr:cupin domain-containing protein [Polaribacter vadi]AOW18238.1 mannose-6-phosphate isomerase [Polaribacter vadi]OBY62971.1 mannose-6-phosphate isomerase [Polaribacter vadi]|tara:strand:+ start:298 stop:657 length:360 start_codon:yes stop_codon:yes gene_type:complete
MSVINIQEKFKLFSDLWSPKKVGELNGQQILLAKLKGEFVFHKHEFEDELFMVIKGTLEIELRDKTITLKEGEFYIVPKGVEHKPIAKEEVHIVLFEPLSIKHTGNVVANITVETYENI